MPCHPWSVPLSHMSPLPLCHPHCPHNVHHTVPIAPMLSQAHSPLPRTAKGHRWVPRGSWGYGGTCGRVVSWLASVGSADPSPSRPACRGSWCHRPRCSPAGSLGRAGHCVRASGPSQGSGEPCTGWPVPGLWCPHAHPWHQPTFLLVQVIVDVFLQLDVGRVLGPGQQLAQLALPVMVESPGRHSGSLAWHRGGTGPRGTHVGTQHPSGRSDPGVTAPCAPTRPAAAPRPAHRQARLAAQRWAHCSAEPRSSTGGGGSAGTASSSVARRRWKSLRGERWPGEHGRSSACPWGHPGPVQCGTHRAAGPPLPHGVCVPWNRGVPALQGGGPCPRGWGSHYPPMPWDRAVASTVPLARTAPTLPPHPPAPRWWGPGPIPEPRAVARASRTPSTGSMAAAPRPRAAGAPGTAPSKYLPAVPGPGGAGGHRTAGPHVGRGGGA